MRGGDAEAKRDVGAAVVFLVELYGITNATTEDLEVFIPVVVGIAVAGDVYHPDDSGV